MDPATLFLGVVVSTLVQMWKRVFGKSGLAVTIIAVVMSLLGAVAYALAAEADYIDSIVSVLTTAGAFYAFIIKQIENNT